MNDRQQILSILPPLIALCFLSLVIQTSCIEDDMSNLSSVASLAYGSMTAICLASRHHCQLSNIEFSVLSAAPLIILANFGALLALASTIGPIH